ncbi:hypothetical protein K493DRAFT_303756 [Basidiobolus meristosporus CBS 931.73]|uniref:Extracellular membrane protein CFEM domain-containing protein n=1 Tax=Basidiobolus meristosporus CBS 931.73 TaxID=1314790 RepID=A0A1Y1Y1S2_9FUNG|nr:hypothetical protein K493DRAFT_303756 [Basidiobolus meristosporus CBS 931.73]|eukprot:ORX91845.1 hypothetical protein K493DRAFT_303756 [Basidiobolus meristosporus CBS 931.73]
MKVLAIATAAYLIACSQAATNFLPKAGPGNQCEAADTYNQCIDNAMTTTCSSTDNTCNCKQAQNLVACVNYCSKDASIAGLGVAEQSEVSKWCSAASSASLPTATTDTASKPTGTQASTAAPSKALSATSPSTTTVPSGGKSGAGRMEMCMGLLGIIVVISSLV